VEAVLEEEAVAEVATLDLIGEIAGTVYVGRGGCGFDYTRARGRDAVIGIIERVDVDRLPQGVL
jgi:hypothetical protein